MDFISLLEYFKLECQFQDFFILQIILCRVNYVEASVNKFQSAYQKFELLSWTYSKSEMDGDKIFFGHGHGKSHDFGKRQKSVYFQFDLAKNVCVKSFTF